MYSLTKKNKIVYSSSLPTLYRITKRQNEAIHPVFPSTFHFNRPHIAEIAMSEHRKRQHKTPFIVRLGINNVQPHRTCICSSLFFLRYCLFHASMCEAEADIIYTLLHRHRKRNYACIRRRRKRNKQTKDDTRRYMDFYL